MASRWSSEFVVTEHRDLQASAMTMDRDGNNILLAGKRYIAVKSLTDSSDLLRKFVRHNKYEVGTAEWNPTIVNSHFCAISTNQRIELLCWRENNLELAHTLKFHTRLVSDLNWHRFDPNILASSSVDTFTHVWDIRDPRRPSITFSAVASANHVRWNKLSSFLLATAHDGDIRIWDQRKGTAPIQYISAHLAKIHGLDWSQTHEYQLASCSQDGTVKFFDVTNPRCPESIIQTAAPVWRARYTPFGEGLVTVVVPQSRRGENSLLLWNLSNQSMPVHTFVGHSDVVLEFEWRKQRLDFSDYQMITWSRDQSLRIWRIEPFLQKLCGYDMDGDSRLGEDLDSDIVNITNNDLPSVDLNGFVTLDNDLPAVEAINVDSFTDLESTQCLDRSSLSPQDSSRSLELELSLLSTNINSSHFKFDEMNVLNRSCMVTATVNSHVVSLQITFPPNYPYNAAPSFQIGDNSTIDTLLKTKLLKVLKQTAQQRVKKNRICFESCLTQLVNTLERTVQMQEIENKTPSRLPALEPSLNIANSYLYGTVHDAHIPYPKTCGARFCSVDVLVCFYRPTYPRRMSTRPDTTTPRSLSAVATNSSYSNLTYPMMFGIPTSTQDVTDGSLPYYMQGNVNRSHSSRSGSVHISGRPQPKPLKTVTLYDCSKLFFIHKELGEKYVFDPNDVAGMCYKNADIAGSLRRQDLVQIWTLAALVATPFSQGTENDDDIPWPHHPFSRSLIEYLIMHYAKMTDIQTAAMLCCAFSAKNDHKGFGNKNINSKSVTATPGGSPYHTIHPADTTLEGWNFPAIKQNRSNSWSESLDDLKFMANILEHREMAEIDYEKNKMLDDKNSTLYDEFKKKYADILHRWNLLEARAQVTKFLSVSIDPHRTVEFLTECQSCKKPIIGPSYCTSCKKVTLRCAVCRILVRGSSNFCLICGHGGHTNHMMTWFKNETSCPTGCGCKCVKESLNLFES